MSTLHPLEKIGKLPTEKDNCAVATRLLEANMEIASDSIGTFKLSHNVLEGHRFAAQPIPAGQPLLSWGQPFGRALRDIAVGEYICNAKVLAELADRQLAFELPSTPNFSDDLAFYEFNDQEFVPAPPVKTRSTDATFMGYARPNGRGTGTRNMIVLMATCVQASGFVQQLETLLKGLIVRYEHIDDVVAIAHTEGGRIGANNEELLLRTLAGYLVHPNIGAVLCVDYGARGVTNEMVQSYAAESGIQVDDLPCCEFLSLGGSFSEMLAKGTRIVTSWFDTVNMMPRTPRPLSELKIALQCGGSDAFSGISGNPLAAWVAHEVIKLGGAAVLAETDELIGAQAYVLNKVVDSQTATRFLDMVDRFQVRTERHGYSAKGNPSGGNLFRGLYNIYLKSLGAATKRHPDSRLDGVLDYGERMPAGGYYFMDSPGNDLESIAGQVATGCNMIFFVTGNGSITNFPFVPTIKIVTTTARYEMLSNEMDINAGAYLDGSPIDAVGEQTLAYTIAAASGQHTVGEKAGHTQVQLWRNWQLDDEHEDSLLPAVQPTGQAIKIPHPDHLLTNKTDSVWHSERRNVGNQIGLILPSSLCSGEIAKIAADQLNAAGVGTQQGITRFVALAHTEGCGSPTISEFIDTMLGYLTHPMAASSLILEHGCEKTHNDFWRRRLEENDLSPDKFGWASIQLDGGIAAVIEKIHNWFEQDVQNLMPSTSSAGYNGIKIGIMCDGRPSDHVAAVLVELIKQITAADGQVIMPFNDQLLAHPTCVAEIGECSGPNGRPTIPFAVSPKESDNHSGLHLMATPSDQWAETMTGLGATGVELIVSAVSHQPQTIHPFIPTLQISGNEGGGIQSIFDEIDVAIADSTMDTCDRLLQEIRHAISAPHLKNEDHTATLGNVGFQITRGRLGVSL